MLPNRPPRVPGVQIAHRYLPGDRRAEVGGDWFDAVQLPGSRVALVVGDVMGHGLHSAAAMGRFRTAMQTLAALDLPPGQILRHLDNLSQRLGDDHLATCLYAVYDPVARTCTLASAGHVPPVLVHPDGRGELLDIPSGAPIGVGGVPFAATEIKVTDGSMLVLCTDGLVEMRGGDIGDGLAALCGDIVDPRQSPDEVCDTVLERLHTEDRNDDLALLIARFDGIPPQDVISWSLALDETEVRRSRALVEDQLRHWELDELSETAQLLVSELVTNALRVAKGSVELQLMRVGKLLVEVSDDDHNLPSLEPSELLDEEGRGLGLVSQLSARWGTSRKAVGKVVWFELPLPPSRV
ncbi:SpoIIE family protein phosphatase [Streptacidiphilus monticola]